MKNFSFIHISDLHIYDKHKYSIDNSRLKMIKRNLNKISEFAISKLVNMVIITGDIFHTHNPDERCLNVR